MRGVAQRHALAAAGRKPYAGRSLRRWVGVVGTAFPDRASDGLHGGSGGDEADARLRTRATLSRRTGQDASLAAYFRARNADRHAVGTRCLTIHVDAVLRARFSTGGRRRVLHRSALELRREEGDGLRVDGSGNHQHMPAETGDAGSSAGLFRRARAPGVCGVSGTGQRLVASGWGGRCAAVLGIAERIGGARRHGSGGPGPRASVIAGAAGEALDSLATR